jgi:hypothetical protein
MTEAQPYLRETRTPDRHGDNVDVRVVHATKSQLRKEQQQLEDTHNAEVRYFKLEEAELDDQPD